jgi:hypothetical protein
MTMNGRVEHRIGCDSSSALPLVEDALPIIILPKAGDHVDPGSFDLVILLSVVVLPQVGDHVDSVFFGDHVDSVFFGGKWFD